MADKHWKYTRPMVITAAAWWAGRLNLQAKTGPFVAEIVTRCHELWKAKDFDQYARKGSVGWLFKLEWDYDAKEILGEALEAIGEKSSGLAKVAAYTRIGPFNIDIKDGYGASRARFTSEGLDATIRPASDVTTPKMKDGDNA